MSPIALQGNEIITGRLPKERTRISPWALGAAGLGSGLFALVAVRLGVGSWMVLGSAFVIWCLSGWRFYFADSPSQRNVRILGYIFLSTGLLVGAAILAKIYLVALGPPWIL